MARQMQLFPPLKLTAALRRELIRAKLDGFRWRQAARAERRRKLREARRSAVRGRCR